MPRKTLLVFFFALLFSSNLVAFGLGFSLKESNVTSKGFDITISISTSQNSSSPVSCIYSLWKVLSLIDTNFVDVDKLDYNKMSQEVAKAMAAFIRNEPLHKFSRFMTKEESATWHSNKKGEYEGIGVLLAKQGNLVFISYVYDNTPAYRADIHCGDIIQSIDGKSVNGMSVEEATALFRGKTGTSVLLSISRYGKKIDNIKVSREFINSNRLIRRTLGSIGYMRLYHFSADNLYSDLRDTYDFFKSNGVDRLIIDLRYNFGGYSYNFSQFCGVFVGSGQLLCSRHKARGKIEVETSSIAAIFPREWPIICLVDSNTASAAEITSGILRELRGAVLIGEKTLGKSTEQTFFDIDGFGQLELTTAYVYLPSGYLINGVGLVPDIKVEMTWKDYCSRRDPVLNKAIEFILKK